MDCSHDTCRNQSEEICSKLCEKLKDTLTTWFYQTGMSTILKMPDNSLCPPEVQLQGSAADGFIIDGSNKSDIDFLHPMDIFNPSLEYKLISDPRSPGQVKIEIIPNISEGKTDMEKDKLMTNIEHIDGQYFLNMQQIKHEICEQFRKKIKYNKECQVAIKSENNSCFMIQFDYDFYHVIPYYMEHLKNIMKGFSESILKIIELNENIKKQFSNLSAHYFVNKFNWNEFKDKFSFINRKIITSPQKIINRLQYYLKEISDEIIEKCFSKFSFFTIIEDCFYLLLLILMSCGLDTIVEVICDKITIVNENIFLIFLNSYCKSLYYFNEEEKITKLKKILSEPITDEEKAIENIFYEFLEKFTIELKNKIKDKNIDYTFPEFSFVRMEDLSNGVSMNKLHWLLTMIELLMQLLEYIKYYFDSIQSFESVKPLNQRIEIVPGLYFTGWPLIASDWVRKERYWPKPEIIERIINNCYHVVFKSLNYNNGYHGRLSFSEAETILCKAMTHDQFIIFRFIKCQIKSILSEKFKSYYIKTLCLRVFESTPLDSDSTNMQQTYLQDIIKHLGIALKKKTLQHYFIPQHNLFIELNNHYFDEINKHLLQINPIISESDIRFGVYEQGNEIPVTHFFKLVENMFFKSISEIIK